MRPDFIVDLLPAGALSVTFPFDPQAIQIVKAVVGRRWHPAQKFWSIPANALRPFKEQAARVGYGVAVGEKVSRALNLGQERREKLLVAKSDETPMELPTKTIPYPFQYAGIRFAQYALHNFRGALIGDDLGLGKTFSALSIVALHPKLGRVLIVVPSSLKYMWADQIDEHYPQLSYTVIGAPMNGKRSAPTPTLRAQQWAESTQIKIVNYELLLRDMAPRVIEWDLVIGDECGNAIKNYKAERTKRMKKLRRKYTLGLSGIPLENRLEELHSVMDFVMPGVLGPGWVFVQQHVVKDWMGRTVGYRGIEQVRERIAPYYIRRTKAEVLPELPPKVYSNVSIEMSSKEWALYDDIKQQIKDKIADNPKLNAANILVEMLRLKQANADARLLDVDGVSSSKLDALYDLCQSAKDSGHKVVIFTQFAQLARHIVDDLARIYDEPIPLIAGNAEGRKQTQEKRADIVRSFQTGKHEALVSTDAGAYGITLTAANIIVHVDLPWNPAKMRQREDRLHRIGQGQSVQVVTLICRRTVDEYVRSILHKKLAIIGAVMDEKNPEDEAVIVHATREDLLALVA